MRRVLVLMGTPGVGKTSVAKLLAQRLKGVPINLSELVKSDGLSCGYDKKRETLVADTEKVAKRVGKVIAQTKGYVVVEGHFATDVVAAKDAFKTFVLRRDPDELRKALTERGFKESKVAENVAAEILDVCLFDAVNAYGKDKVCEVDVSRRSLEKVVDELISVTRHRGKCRVGVVDWLTKLEMEKRLDEFLATF
ncbi:MAG: adenylate kinase family protein [Candidatus Bathyarchaeia archaeon]